MAGGPGNARGVSGTYRGPEDEVLRHQWRRERRAVVRDHHPDQGGMAGVMHERLDALDSRYRRQDATASGTTQGPAQAPVWQPLTRAARRTRRSLRRLTRVGRAKLPPGWPGHRGYIDL